MLARQLQQRLRRRWRDMARCGAIGSEMARDGPENGAKRWLAAGGGRKERKAPWKQMCACVRVCVCACVRACAWVARRELGEKKM